MSEERMLERVRARVFTVRHVLARPGKLKHVVHRSAALGINKSYYIYLPSPGAESVRERFPALYVFRGHQREWINPRQDGSRGGRTVIDAYEDLLRAGRLGPMILVFPGIASDDNTVSGALVNMREPERAAGLRGIGSGRFEDYFVQDLLPHVEEEYPVLPGSAHRGVDGFSMGGFMAVKVALGHPGMFSTVGAYDGMYFYGRNLAKDKALRNRMFDSVFGVPRDLAYVAQNNPVHLMQKAAPEELARMSWFLEYGSEAGEPFDSNFYRGRDLVRQLARRGIRNDGGVVAGGHHDWATADGHMARTLPKHYAALRGSL